MKRKVPEQLSLDLPSAAKVEVLVESMEIPKSETVVSFDQTKALRTARDKERRIQTLLSLVTHFRSAN